ncbi:hypothetical protein J8M21_18165 [Pseudoalteromonas luteoviolacea]|uniref:hypothetical protein n=1 Tax=Pseudoalteromonas luteoviolacea TaxID=43657 RepID=UPI001B39E6A5|nr:hypothetical protein [Pseudoalteromonas luteoviolacea]MBQ4879146.1 hypothetical protein [Pseudoalteromonas luteoviolacea]MBQ4908205.1 hypothetical protein [Pseudoalteromonas luteoviolacea]
MKEFYSLVEFLPLTVIAISLLLTWKVPTARWFLICYAVLDIVIILLNPTIMQWRTHYYLADLFMCIALVLPIVYRRPLALFLYEKTHINYFLLVFNRQVFTLQECGIILLMLFGAFINLVSWLEILAYKYYWIDVPYLKLYVRNNAMILVHVGVCCANLVMH